MQNYIRNNANLSVMSVTKDSSLTQKKKTITENTLELNLSYASSVDIHSDTKVHFLEIFLTCNRSLALKSYALVKISRYSSHIFVF